MKLNQSLFVVLILTALCAASAQTPANSATSTKPATPNAKHATTTAKPATTSAKPGTTATHTATTANKLPPGVPVVRGIVKSAFALRYEDITIGTGAVAVPNKMYKVNYTGYLGSNGRDDDGHKFDSSVDHRTPVMGKDGKPVMGDDGKPKLGDPQPMAFPQGFGRLIPGFDQGFEGMKVGGKRRLFIPWQLAYGSAGRPGPDPAHPLIPPKADLIFDVELVDMSDMPAAPQRPLMPATPPHPFGAATPQPGSGAPPHPGMPGTPATITAPATPGAPPAPGTAPAPPPASAPAAPAKPATPVTPPQSN